MGTTEGPGWNKNYTSLDLTKTDLYGRSITHYCALAGCGDLLGKLLNSKKGQVIDAKDNKGHTALHFAVLSSDVGAVQELLKVDYDSNFRL